MTSGRPADWTAKRSARYHALRELGASAQLAQTGMASDKAMERVAALLRGETTARVCERCGEAPPWSDHGRSTLCAGCAGQKGPAKVEPPDYAMTFREIAKAIGVSVTTVQNDYHSALTKLEACRDLIDSF